MDRGQGAGARLTGPARMSVSPRPVHFTARVADEVQPEPGGSKSEETPR
jgi:hypothetical protein